LPKSSNNSVRIVVSGLVQGVGFRWFVLRQAQALGLKGYTCNLPSGQVEVIASGDKGLIDELVKSLRVGPGYASVSDVQLEEIKTDEKFNDFGIR
jgi:acylphosphatase